MGKRKKHRNHGTPKANSQQKKTKRLKTRKLPDMGDPKYVAPDIPHPIDQSSGVNPGTVMEILHRVKE